MIISVGTIVKDEQGDKYILDEILGRGGFACVYKAHRERDGYIVAVKTLLSSFGSQEDMLSFQKECLQAKLISSEHVIKYFADIKCQYNPLITISGMKLERSGQIKAEASFQYPHVFSFPSEQIAKQMILMPQIQIGEINQGNGHLKK